MSTLRNDRVGYWIEQGHVISVQARSPQHAERLIRRRLDDEMDRLDDSERVHHDDGISTVDLVRNEVRHG